jgi:hypothetical protein
VNQQSVPVTGYVTIVPLRGTSCVFAFVAAGLCRRGDYAPRVLRENGRTMKRHKHTSDRRGIRH